MAIPFLALAPIVLKFLPTILGAVSPKAGGIVGGLLKDLEQGKVSEEEATAKMTEALTGASAEIAASQADIIKAEINSDSWLARNWRPIVALTAFFSYWWVVFGIPHFVLWGWMGSPKFGEVGLANMFVLTTVCVGGYVGGRSLEKIAQVISRRRR